MSNLSRTLLSSSDLFTSASLSSLSCTEPSLILSHQNTKNRILRLVLALAVEILRRVLRRVFAVSLEGELMIMNQEEGTTYLLVGLLELGYSFGWKVHSIISRSFFT